MCVIQSGGNCKIFVRVMGHGWVSVGEVCNGGTVGKATGMGVDT